MAARRFLILLAAIGGLLAAPVAASASPSSGYPIEPPASTVSDATVTEGHAVTFSGRGFLPGEPISINIAYQDTGAALHGTQHVVFVGAAYKTVTASSAGTFSTSVRLSQSGVATLTAFGTVSHVTVSEVVHAVVAGSSGALAVTGQSGRHWTTELSVGFGAIVVGGLLAFGAVRLRRRPTLR